MLMTWLTGLFGFTPMACVKAYGGVAIEVFHQPGFGNYYNILGLTMMGSYFLFLIVMQMGLGVNKLNSWVGWRTSIGCRDYE